MAVSNLSDLPDRCYGTKYVGHVSQSYQSRLVINCLLEVIDVEQSLLIRFDDVYLCSIPLLCSKPDDVVRVML